MFSMLFSNREFEKCFFLIWNVVIAQNEINVQGELAKKTDNRTVSNKHCKEEMILAQNK